MVYQRVLSMLKNKVWSFSVLLTIYIFGVNLKVQDLLHQDARIQDLYFNISLMKLSITYLFSIQIMSYLGASDIIYRAM